MKYRVSPQAEQDLIDIWSFVAQDSPARADRLVDTIKLTFAKLASSPELGRSREELACGVRSLVIRRYRRYIVFYRLQPEVIDIVRVLDGGRDLKRLFQRE